MNLETTRGRKVESPFASDEEAADALDKLLAAKRLGSSQGFAAAILSAFRNKRASHDQRCWIHILAAKPTPPSKEQLRGTIDFAPINLLFATAQAKGLTRMRLRLNGMVIRPDYSGDHLVVIRTRGERKLIAHVEKGQLLLGQFVKPEEEAELRALAADPVKHAHVYGARTGHCMFCGLTLTTAESVGSGYGPVCAEKWGLPWASSAGAQRERDIRRFMTLAETINALKRKS